MASITTNRQINVHEQINLEETIYLCLNMLKR